MAEAKKFVVPEGTKFYKMKNGEYVLNEKGGRIEVDVYHGITFDYIVDWLEKNGTAEDKADFKKNYYSYKDGTPMPIRTYKQTGEKYQMSNFLNAKNKFFERHNKDYLPTKKEEEPKAKKAERIANW